MSVTQAVIAAGGIGSTMLPMTTVLAKEMLPVRDKPILEHIITELHDAGIQRVLFVISARKTHIVEYFGSGTWWGMEFTYRVQDPGDGPGAPVLLAERWSGGQPFVYAFGDNLTTTAPGHESPLRRLLTEHTAHPANWALLAEVCAPAGLPRNETVLGPTTHPIGHQSAFDFTDADPGSCTDQVIVCAARWVLTPAIFAAQRSCHRRSNGELYLIDAVQQAVPNGQRLRIVPLAAADNRYNMDNWPTYHACAADLARREIDLVAPADR
ncbi:MAG: sugar phosphate nucleotidyltransferase [Pseudonocardia sp.]